MIHQFIFAAPKPGMTEQEFQDYWVNVHAVKYASKIPQIKQYSVSARLPFGHESQEPLWSGLADIWLENEADQVASLWSKEMLEGARVDEPSWAAFWRTVVLDTEAHVFKDGGGLEAVKDGVKLVALVKRKWGMSVEEFRQPRPGDPGAARPGAAGPAPSTSTCHRAGRPLRRRRAAVRRGLLPLVRQPRGGPGGARLAGARGRVADLPTFLEMKYLPTSS